MPTYEFRCPSGHQFDRLMKMSESVPELPCPECGATATRQMSGGAGLVFKGSGFYLTDYGKNAHRTSGPAKPGADPKPASDSKPGAADARSGDAKPSAGGGGDRASGGSGSASSGGSGSSGSGSSGSGSSGSGSSGSSGSAPSGSGSSGSGSSGGSPGKGKSGGEK